MAALALTKYAPPWIALVALIVFVWIGARLGKNVGDKLFEGDGPFAFIDKRGQAA